MQKGRKVGGRGNRGGEERKGARGGQSLKGATRVTRRGGMLNTDEGSPQVRLYVPKHKPEGGGNI